MKKSAPYSYNDLLSVIWVSVCAFVLCYGFSSWINYKAAFYYSATLGFGTFFIYTIASGKGFHENTSLIFQALFSLFFTGVFFFLSNLNLISIFLLTGSSLVSYLYVRPPSQLNINIRDVPSLKIIIVSLVWLLSCFIIPILSSGFKPTLLFLLISAFLLLLVNIVPFDIRDRKTDAQNLKTIPQVLGVSFAIKLALILILLAGTLILFEKVSPLFKIAFGLNCIYVMVLLILNPKIRQYKIYFLLLDSSLFLLGIAFLLDKLH